MIGWLIFGEWLTGALAGILFLFSNSSEYPVLMITNIGLALALSNLYGKTGGTFT